MYLVKRHQTYWALHDVPRRLHDKLGRRLSKSLGTSNKSQAERLANILWLHDWKRQIDGEAAAVADDKEALFFRALIRNANTDEERESLKDHVGDLARDRAERALTRGDEAAADEAIRFAHLATGRIIPLTEHLDEWLAAIDDTDKTKAMKRAEVLKLGKQFAHVQDVGGPAAAKWLSGLAKGGASAKTIGRILSFLRGYWKYLREQGITAADPFAGLSPPSTARKGKSWVPFSPTQVVTLKKLAAKEGDKELADLIDLGMWSGARIEELCALKVAEVGLKGKAFSVSDAKTEAGIREVPIHESLLPTMRRLIGDRRDGYVLADLKPNKFGDRSNAIGKRFGRLKKAAGFGKSHVFHSIRKTVVTLLENAGVSENLAADIVGHEKPRITYGLYSGGATLAVKRAALAKLRYPM
ncbi:MAG: tyrosine-type recombinase/integrase [Reyranella sp.]|nr:tyrosine-type recombinase/integrase [Reyranella sp.]